MTMIDGKYLSYILRHAPSAAHVALDDDGYADVNALIDGIKRAGKDVDLSELERIVATDGKRRFSFNDDRTKIRANYGHSVAVDLHMKDAAPPAFLYHGTALKNLCGIAEKGIQKRSRNFVHLSTDRKTAASVGARHGQAVVLKVAAAKMHDDGHAFFLSESGVWLTDFVPCQYVSLANDACKIPPFEMTSLGEKRTGIPGRIWLFDKGAPVSESQYLLIYENAGTACVCFANAEPKTVASENPLQLQKVIEWTKRNREPLLRLYGAVDDYDIGDFLREMKPEGGGVA